MPKCRQTGQAALVDCIYVNISIFQMESGGTVLSTNWKEVAGQKVDVKPPDGMEFKKWNE